MTLIESQKNMADENGVAESMVGLNIG